MGIIERHKYTEAVRENEAELQRALEAGGYVQVVMLSHALIESYLREFLGEKEDEVKFSYLIKRYRKYLDSIKYPIPTFVEDLTQFNRRRNRVVHQLWKKGYKRINEDLKDVAGYAQLTYALYVQWLLTFDPDEPQTEKA
ncbi:MAG: hypothetical protein BMS9Abin09_1083 [Gammaproteobacteria bacterium]|nr:MAG: hypothetical protein BMS9Abin09_1083 [Gammaproteobacteria bacterium]